MTEEERKLKIKERGYKVLEEISDIFKKYKPTVDEILGYIKCLEKTTRFMKVLGLEPFIDKEKECQKK